MRKPVEFAEFPHHPGYALCWAAVVKAVVDGDTIDVLIDPGWNEYPYRTIRYRDINAPEMRGADKAAGQEARLYLQELLPLGTQVFLLDTSPDPETFGRYVSRVVRVSDGLDTGEAMVTTGHARRVSGGDD